MKAGRMYRAVLQFYPAKYRALFSGEMSGVFEAQALEHRAKGRGSYLAFLLAEATGLIIALPKEWIARSIHPASYVASPCGQAAGADDSSIPLPVEVREAKTRVDLVVSRMVHAIANHDFQNARYYSEQERQEREALRLLQQKHNIAPF